MEEEDGGGGAPEGGRGTGCLSGGVWSFSMEFEEGGLLAKAREGEL